MEGEPGESGEQLMLSSTSGAAKKRRLKQLKNARDKLPKITNFFSATATHTDSDKNEDTNTQANVQSDPDPMNVNSAETEIIDVSIPSSSSASSVVSDKFEKSTREPQTTAVDFVNDIGHFQNQILTAELKRRIINTLSSRPVGPFPRDPSQQYRKFSITYYKKETPYGSIDRQWLCYSTILDAVYCEPCWLFSNTKMDNWRQQGIRDWRGLTTKIKIHEASQSHSSSCYIYEKWKHNTVIDKDLEEKIKYEACFWTQVLERLINITLTLAKNCLAFRGHRESLSETYNGNFLSMVQIIAKYDDVLTQVVNLPKGTTKYLSHKIQDEIINILCDKVKSCLISKVKKAPFFSVMMDTTQDLSKKDQLSQVVRYVEILKNEKDEPIALEIKESFLGFTEVHDHSAAGLSSKIVQLIEDSGLSFDKCRGQGYDGAAVMSGVYGGVQALIKEKQPKATYIHCAAHNLNLVIGDAVKCSLEIQSYFSILEEIYVFFGNSLPRWDILSNITEESQITLKRLNPTRWAGRVTSLMAVKLRFVDIIKALDKIILCSSKRDERQEAENIKKRCLLLNLQLHVS